MAPPLTSGRFSPFEQYASSRLGLREGSRGYLNPRAEVRLLPGPS
jgi:hypothetical protein